MNPGRENQDSSEPLALSPAFQVPGVAVAGHNGVAGAQQLPALEGTEIPPGPGQTKG